MSEKKSVVSSDYGGTLPVQTRSLCPECKRVLDAEIFAGEDGKVYIHRKCPQHGEWNEIYWESAEYYNWAKQFAAKARGVDNPNVGKEIENNGKNCPMDCGLCANHHTHTGLANIALTNRCDLSCWYCFFYAKSGDPVYEPSMEQLRAMLENLRSEKPIATNALQLTGGEPTLRKDLPEIVEMARELGFEHIQLNTHGMVLGKDLELCKRLKKAGVNTLYMSFDGTTPQTNPKNHWEAPQAIENCRKAGIGIVLVPTLIRTVNEKDMGNILNFGLNNLDVVRAVNFQPVSLVGRMPKNLRNQQRITIPGALKEIEEQTNGLIARSDFFPIPCVSSVSEFVSALSGQRQYELSVHFACGAATYLFLDGNKPVPITRFVNIEGLFEYLDEQAQELKKGKNKLLVGGKVVMKLGQFIDKKKQPKDLDLIKILYNALVLHNYDALGKIHERSMLVGMMHFMDPYNYDQQRVERCDIHYAMPDGRIIPFCSFNVLPELYRDKVQAQYSFSWKEFAEKFPQYDVNYKYKRDQEELEKNPLYQKAYLGQKEFFGREK
ncbi:MAG: radical SAM protein [Candidatus Diapherotrites archaeon]